MSLHLPEYITPSEFEEGLDRRYPRHEIIAGDEQVLSFYYSISGGDYAQAIEFAKTDALIRCVETVGLGRVCVDIGINYVDNPISPIPIVLGADDLALPHNYRLSGFFAESDSEAASHLICSTDIEMSLDFSVFEDA